MPTPEGPGLRKESTLLPENIPATIDDVKMLRKKLHPDLFQGDEIRPNAAVGEKGSPLYHARELTSILNAIADRNHNRVDEWPNTYGPFDGREYFLVRPGEAGEVVLSPEPVVLPDTPEQFVRGLKFFVAGKPWDEVVKQLDIELETEEEHRERREYNAPEKFFAEFATVTSLEELPLMFDQLAGKYPDERQKVIAMASHRTAEICKQMLAKVKDLQGIREVKSRFERFFSSKEGSELLMTETLDTIDAWAIQHIREKMRAASRVDDLTSLGEQIREYEFAMDEFQRRPLLEALDERARARMISSLKARGTRTGLDRLEADLSSFTFFADTEAGEAFKEQLHDWIRRKKDILVFREKTH